MFDFFFQGGAPGMTVVILTGLGALIWSILTLNKYFKLGTITKRQLDTILFLGSLSFFTGILWQGIGMSQALAAIQSVPNISPAAVAGGLKVSMIPVLTGGILFFLSSIFWFALRLLDAKKQEA